MRKTQLLLLTFLLLAPPTYAEEDFHENTKNATVLIASYDREGNYLGRGSGFYVDEGIVITNIHVIDGYARYYRIFTTGADGRYDKDCFQDINRSDVKLNLEDDVAYLRAYISCPHTSVFFSATDPKVGTNISVYGFPAIDADNNSVYDMTRTDGTILQEIEATVGLKSYNGPWLQTDAVIHGGNSGGPIVQNGRVVGIAVAAHEDNSGTSVDGIFIPVSIILKGLENANNSTFGYTPQILQDNEVYKEAVDPKPYGTAGDPFDPLRNRILASHLDCFESLGQGGEADGVKGCRCKPSYHRENNICAPGSVEQNQEVQPSNEFTVVRVIDGDTIVVKINNTEETVRIIGIDTPETVDPRKPVQCFGTEASAKLKNIIAGKKVTLIKNPAEERDKYNRLLRYVELTGLDIGAEMIEQGYAHSYRTYAHPRLQEYNNLETAARNAKRGLWTKCEEQIEFTDVRSADPYVSAITWGKHNNIIGGYPDGSFKPNRTVNRAEFLKIALEAKGVDISTVRGFSGFSDVPTDAWFAPYVLYAKQHGIVEGYSDGTFKPEQTVNFAEALKIAYVALGVEGDNSETGEWYDTYLQHAKRRRVLFSNEVDVRTGMSRKDVVWIVWKLSTALEPEQTSTVLSSGTNNCTIKGNISYTTEEKIYHVVGCENYDDTVINEAKGERYFCTEREALRAGWRKALNCR